MYENIFFLFEIIGTISFAISGAMTGLKKEMDIFGVAILGVCTAVGGGVTRDIILGITPPGTFTNPIYAFIAIITSIIVFLPFVQQFFEKQHHLYDIVMLFMDSIGLGVFTVVGVETAYTHSDTHSIFLFTFVGVITGVGGGILRDVLASDTPYVFVKHFYACASIIGALTCALLWNFHHVFAVIFGATIVTALRLCAAYFHWSLPKSSIRKNQEKKVPE